MKHCIFKTTITDGIDMKVFLRNDKKYTVSIIGGGNVFSFTVNNEQQIHDVATKFAALDAHFAMDFMAEMEKNVDTTF